MQITDTEKLAQFIIPAFQGWSTLQGQEQTIPLTYQGHSRIPKPRKVGALRFQPPLKGTGHHLTYLSSRLHLVKPHALLKQHQTARHVPLGFHCKNHTDKPALSVTCLLCSTPSPLLSEPSFLSLHNICLKVRHGSFWRRGLRSQTSFIF